MHLNLEVNKITKNSQLASGNKIIRLKYNTMITDAQIFLALAIALIAAVFAIGLGRQLYV
jgi:photosystem I reaction center subunit XII